jgi:hypothetical protein
MLLVRSAARAKPEQLWNRLQLQARRRMMASLGRRLNVGRMVSFTGEVHFIPRLLPVFATRHDLVRTDHGALRLRLANREWPFSLPMAWHPAELSKGTRLEKLHLHSMEYLEAVDDDCFTATVEDWIAQNPPYRPEYWLDSWNSYATSIRTVVWMQQLARRVNRIAVASRGRIERSLYEQLRFLSNNLERDIGGNHLIKNVKALLWGGSVFAGAEPSRWRALGRDILRSQLREQILSDGMHFELSPAYHLQVFADLLECAMVPGILAEIGEFGKVLGRMAQVAANIAHPDGAVSLFNDGGLHMAYSPAACLTVYEQILGRRPVPQRSFVLPRAGLFGVRDKTTFVLADFGPVGPPHLPAHTHADTFAFEWTIAGKRAIVDAGVFEYNDGEWRSYARSTKSHNTVTVADQDQCGFWKSFRMSRGHRVRTRLRSQSLHEFDVEGEHDGFAHLSGAPIHRRRFKASPDHIVVTDKVAGGSGQTVTARLLLAPGFSAAVSGKSVYVSDGAVHFQLEASHPVEPHTAWWCPDFNVRHACIQLSIQYGVAPCGGSFTLKRII